jgi:hypothetical protein
VQYFYSRKSFVPVQISWYSLPNKNCSFVEHNRFRNSVTHGKLELGLHQNMKTGEILEAILMIIKSYDREDKTNTDIDFNYPCSIFEGYRCRPIPKL